MLGMDILLMNKKAFLLTDSLVCLLITICISSLCVYTFLQIDNYHESYKLYYENINEEYANIYYSIPECEKCEIEEVDLEEDL